MLVVRQLIFVATYLVARNWSIRPLIRIPVTYLVTRSEGIECKRYDMNEIGFKFGPEARWDSYMIPWYIGV